MPPRKKISFFLQFFLHQPPVRLMRAVRILLECILVLQNNITILDSPPHPNTFLKMFNKFKNIADDSQSPFLRFVLSYSRPQTRKTPQIFKHQIAGLYAYAYNLCKGK